MAARPPGCPAGSFRALKARLFVSRSRDPADGLGAQTAPRALRRGPRQGLALGEGRRRQRQAGQVGFTAETEPGHPPAFALISVSSDTPVSGRFGEDRDVSRASLPRGWKGICSKS